MKDISEIVSCVVDYGTFIDLAECMATRVKESLYYSPFEAEYLDVKQCVTADGVKSFSRIDEFMDPDVFEKIDLFIFPDIGYGGLQRYLRSVGKAVWGSMGASDLELYRTKFIHTLKEVGLPYVESKRIVGLSALADYLSTTTNKHVKINRYRGNMETWRHQDFKHSQRKLEELSMEFGPLKDYVIFVVQDDIPDAREIGYDGWTIDGEFPDIAYQGYEKKNQLYLGSRLKYADLPEPVKIVNAAMSPVLREYGYRNFWATEIRYKDGEPYFIDPTARMAGQTMEHQYETCKNLPEVIWKGAHGEFVVPDFAEPFAAEATVHYTAGSPEQWKTLSIPDDAKRWFKLYHYCKAGGEYHFPPGKNDEVGVVIGNGGSIEKALTSLQEHFDLIDGEPVEIRMDGFADLIDEIKKAEAEGMHFSDKPIPEPDIVIN